VKLETENSTLKREMMEQRQQMAVMADSLAFLQQRQERSEEHQKQLMKFIAGVVGKCNVVGVVGGSQCQVRLSSLPSHSRRAATLPRHTASPGTLVCSPLSSLSLSWVGTRAGGCVYVHGAAGKEATVPRALFRGRR
jgi:hypothetical protein